jgi:HlyD family secretion protein
MPDIARDPAILRRKKIRHAGYAVVGVLVLIAVSVALARMEPAAPSVDRDTLLFDTVKRGSLVRQVRGLGTLVPEDTRWIPSQSGGRVERILLQPGAVVEPDSVILELSNPELEQQAGNALLAYESSQATLDNLQAQLRSELITQQASAASLEAELELARVQLEADEEQATLGLLSELDLKRSRVSAATLEKRVALESQRLEAVKASNEARVRVQEAAVNQMRAAYELLASQIAALKVRPGFSGVLQVVEPEVGARVGAGANLARVADPTRLKAELRIAETQAKDIEVGLPAQIDTRNGIIQGIVSRKDPGATNGTVTIDVSLTSELPRGAVANLSVDGTIQLERLDDILYVGRPSLSQEDGTVGLFKVIDDSGNAERTQVQLGASSVNNIEVRGGLVEGDRIVLSDMSAWDDYDRVRLR